MEKIKQKQYLSMAIIELGVVRQWRDTIHNLIVAHNEGQINSGELLEELYWLINAMNQYMICK